MIWLVVAGTVLAAILVAWGYFMWAEDGWGAVVFVYGWTLVALMVALGLAWMIERGVQEITP